MGPEGVTVKLLHTDVFTTAYQCSQLTSTNARTTCRNIRSFEFKCTFIPNIALHPPPPPYTITLSKSQIIYGLAQAYIILDSVNCLTPVSGAVKWRGCLNLPLRRHNHPHSSLKPTQINQHCKRLSILEPALMYSPM